MREVASKTADQAGDGTTTATILAHAIFKEGLRNITAGANPIEVKRGMDKACEAIIAELKKLANAVKDKKEIAQVATISANSDEKIGALIADAMEKVGKDGVITVEEAKSINDELSVVEGMQCQLEGGRNRYGIYGSVSVAWDSAIFSQKTGAPQ